MSNGVCFIAITALSGVLIFISGSPVSGEETRLVSISYNQSSKHENLEENKEYAEGGYFLKDYAQSKKSLKKITPDKSKRNDNPYHIDKNKKPRNPYHDSKKKTTNYKVNKGDTLFSISRKFSIPFNVLCSLNDFSGEEKIKAGAVIKVPASEKTEKAEVAENPVKKNPRNDSPNKKVSFVWPVKDVKNFKQDGADGIKAIGIIITGNPGAKVYPSADGSVEKIGNMRGFGKYVVVRHEGKFVTVYSNLEKISVTEGQKITTKSSIGKIDTENGRLHFQIDYAGKPKNPTSYLPAKS